MSASDRFARYGIQKPPSHPISDCNALFVQAPRDFLDYAGSSWAKY
jgi:hypothetical protein